MVEGRTLLDPTRVGCPIMRITSGEVTHKPPFISQRKESITAPWKTKSFITYGTKRRGHIPRFSKLGRIVMHILEAFTYPSVFFPFSHPRTGIPPADARLWLFLPGLKHRILEFLKSRMKFSVKTFIAAI